MLEGPKGKAFKQDEDILRDPVGRITRGELGEHVSPEVVQYIDQYRAANNLPPLKNYSIEDIKDAMTAVNPAGEAAELDRLLRYKTGYNDEKISVDDVLHAAEAKEIATDTQGFRDFLERATGVNDLNKMSDTQRFSAFQALNRLNKRETGRETILPPGTNASRFTEDQLNEGITLLSPYISQQGGVLTLPSAIEIIKAQTDLKNDRDAYTLLNSATAQGLLTLDKGPVYNIVDKNGEIVGTYETEADAKANAGKRDIVQKSIAQRVAIAQEPKAKRALPKGFEITKTQVEGEVTPAGYQISDVEGKPFPYLVEKLEDLQGKVDQMEGARRAEAEREISGALKIRDALQKRRDNLVKMEALGQADTAEYRKALNQQVIAEREFSKRIQRLLDRAERLKGPLRTKPVGRTVTPKDVYTLTQNGKEIGKFGSEEDAYASMFLTPETEGGLSEAELEDIAVKGGNLGNRAQKALDERQTKGIARKITPALQAKREFVAKAEEIAKNLMPVLKRFGLGNIGLKIVDALEKGAEGKYENQLIHLVMSVKEPLKTLRHESIHALKELGFFTDAQWEALERQADKEWINTYLKNKPYTKGISR